LTIEGYNEGAVHAGRAAQPRSTPMADHWIQGAIKHPGSLRKELHVPEGKDIPKGKLEKAEHSKNPHIARQAHLAEELSHFKHKGK
jgi:hypothetical protein